MALSETVIPIVFSGGIDTETDDKSVVPAKLIALENGVFVKNTTIGKRSGYDALSRTRDTVEGTDLYQNAKALGARGAELLLCADDRLYSYRESSGTWNDAGLCVSIVHTERAIAGTATDQSMPDFATLDGVSVAAWEDSRGGVWWCVIEQETGRILRPAEQLSDVGIQPRCMSVGDRLHVYYADAAGHKIWILVVNPTNYLGTDPPVPLVDTLSPTNPAYDAAPEPSATEGVNALTGVIAWMDDRAEGGYWVSRIDSSGALSGAANWPDRLVGPLAVSRQNQNGATCAVAYNLEEVTESPPFRAYSVRCRHHPFNNLAFESTDQEVFGDCRAWRLACQTSAPFACVFDPGANDAWVWCETANNQLAPTASAFVIRIGAVSTPGNVLAERTEELLQHGLVGRGFLNNDVPHVIIAHEVPFFPYVAALRTYIEGVDVPAATDTTVPISIAAVARIHVGNSDGAHQQRFLSSVHVDADDFRIWRWAGITRVTVDANPSGQQFDVSGLSLVTLDFDHPDAFIMAPWGSDVVIGGAMPWRYDGDRVAELGFHTAPDGPDIVVSPTVGGSMTPSSRYLYAYSYEEIDAQGLVHPGAMSVGTIVDMAATQGSTSHAIPMYPLTSKRAVRIAVWRSEANDIPEDGSLPDMYRVSSLDPSAVGDNGYLQNEVNGAPTSFTDTMSDLTLLTRERAYTNGGVLSNDPVGLGHIVTSGKDRLFWNDPEDPTRVRFSQTRRPGYGPEVSADVAIRFDSEGGDITALAILDDALLALRREEIHFVAGAGPLPNPQAAPQIDFSPPQRVTASFGCSAARSVGVAQDRILFQSPRGIVQIDRGRGVKYIGGPVERYKEQRITSADGVPEQTQILFLTDEGQSLLYDYHHDQWSTFTNHEGTDAVVCNGVYHYLRANAADLRVFRQNPATYLDAAVPYRLYLETAWIKLSGYRQGLQKLWDGLVLGSYESSHQLEFKAGIDFQPGWLEPWYVNVDSDHNPALYGEGPYGEGVYGGESDSSYDQRFQLGLKCKAARFAIGEAVTPPASGASLTLTELLLRGGIMRQTFDVGPSRTQ